MDLTERISEQLGVTREQAAGGAGILLQVARDRLSPDEFVTIADSIPAISDIILKAPWFETPPPRRLLPQLSRLLGGLGSLAGVKSLFAKLGLPKASIRQFVKVLTHFFQEKAGPEVEALLLRALR